MKSEYVLIGLAVILVTLTSSNHAQAREDKLPRIKTWPIPQAIIMNNRFGRLDSCDEMKRDYVQGDWPTGLGLQTLRSIDLRLRSLVTLRADQGLDTWTPLTKAILDGERRISGDCDDFAITSAQLAVCAGFPAADLGLMITKVSGSQKELHLVAYYLEPGRDVWIFGDTFGIARPLGQLDQEIHYHASFRDLTTWWAVRDPRTGELLGQGAPTSSIRDDAVLFDGAMATCGGSSLDEARIGTSD